MGRVLVLLFIILCVCISAKAAMREFRVTDYLRHEWKGELLHFPISFQRGECDDKRFTLTQMPDGLVVPGQLVEATRYPDGSIKQARLALICNLTKGQTRTWTLDTRTAAPTVPSSLAITPDGDRLVLSAGAIALLVPASSRRYRTPAAAADVPAPLLGVKGPDGVWRGHGSLESPEKITRFTAKITERGPVLTAYRIEYRFAGDHYYRVTIELYNGQNYAHITEEADVGPTSRMAFSAYANFAPTHYVIPSQDAQPLTYKSDKRLIRFFFNTYFHQIFDYKDWFALFRDDPAAKDYLAFVKVHGGDWTDPLHNAIYFEEKATPDLRISGTLRPCRREWLVAMFDRTELPEAGKKYPHPDMLLSLCAKVGFAPLDMVKEMTLDWPLQRHERPVTDEERITARELLDDVSGLVNSSIMHGPYGGNHALGYGQRMRIWRMYPKVAGTGALSLEDERYVRAALAYLAYVAMERDFFAWYLPLLPHIDTRDAEEPLQNWRYNFYMMNTNFDASRFCGIAEIAMSLPDHPDHDRFMVHYNQCLKLHLENVFSEDGFYHESISYMSWNIYLLSSTADRVKRETGVDHFADPALHKGFRCLVNLVTPPDPRYPGAPRALPHFGNHDPMAGLRNGWAAMFTIGAEAYARRDPELAGALAWLWQQTGSTGTPPGVAPRQPALHSERIRGWGAVMRSNFGSTRESYVLFRADPFVGRYVNEENNFYLFAKGRPLIVTPADGFEPISTYPLLTANSVNFNGLQSYEAFWGQLGTLDDCLLLNGFDYVCGTVQGDTYQQPGMSWMECFHGKPRVHRRHFLSVGGDYFVITDDVKCDDPADYTLQVVADRAVQQGGIVHCTGRFDVDLDVHFLAPVNPTIEITPTRLLSWPPQIQRPLPMLRLLAEAPANQPFLTVLAPVIRDKEQPARVERLGELLAAHVTQGGKEDYVFLSPSPIRWQATGYSFQGTRALLRVAPNPMLVLLDAGTLTIGTTTLHSTAGGLQLAARPDGSWSGTSTGNAKTVTFTGIKVISVLCDGKAVQSKPVDGGMQWQVPAGEHDLLVK